VEVKICGLTRQADALAAGRAGARYGGVILAPGGPRSVDGEGARRVFEGSGLRRCGVFVDEPLESLLDLAAHIGLDVVQLHGEEEPEVAAAIRAAGPYEVWKAVRPRDAAEFVAAVERHAATADGLLLDGWSAAARGGTGARFPWEAVAERRGVLPGGVRLIVAGGLDPENVERAVELLRPDVVDVSSGVEASPGVKDHKSIMAFVAAAQGTAAEQGRG
jgi:phosphoribosylanthranilate isomerase